MRKTKNDYLTPAVQEHVFFQLEGILNSSGFNTEDLYIQEDQGDNFMDL